MSGRTRRTAAVLALLCLLSLAAISAAPHSHRSADECLLCRFDRIAVVLASAPAVVAGLLLLGAAAGLENDAVGFDFFSPSSPRAPPA
jgi:hypothetical protein